jgi:hypothetical protein
LRCSALLCSAPICCSCSSSSSSASCHTALLFSALLCSSLLFSALLCSSLLPLYESSAFITFIIVFASTLQRTYGGGRIMHVQRVRVRVRLVP